jgi:hypothetical protein
MDHFAPLDFGKSANDLDFENLFVGKLDGHYLGFVQTRMDQLPTLAS